LIGNDIVDLALAAQQSNWKRKGYLHKIFTAEEQLCIMKSTSPDQMVWLLWSMKEAAYKIHSRKKGIRNFAPTALVCHSIRIIKGKVEGAVTIDGENFFTASTLDEEKIHTLCASGKEEIKQIKIILTAPEKRSLLNEHLKIERCLSHHGAFLALAYLEANFPLSED
jgi:phosphopantetheinyl transferase (holo-ACP synthase)